MKILIVSTFFPPQNSIASLRPYSWAKYWSRLGHQVTVLTTIKQSHSSDSPLPTKGFSVVELPVSGIMASIQSTIKSREAPPNAISPNKISTSKKKSKLLKLIYWLKRRYGIYSGCRMPEVTDNWAKIALQEASKEDWDLVVSTAWPYSVHRVGYGLKKSGKTKCWVMDWRDLWTDNHMYPGLPVIRYWEQKLEHRFHQIADLVTTVSSPLAEKLRLKVGDKVNVIYNGFDPEDYVVLSDSLAFPEDEKFRIIYTGSIYAGKQDPSPLFSAIRSMHNAKKITPNRLQVIFVGLNADLTELAMKEKVSEYVEYHGTVPREQALRLQRDADVLLFLEFEAPGVDGILTGKLFEYLFAKTPILAIGIGSASSAGKIIEQYKRGVALGKNSQLIEEWLSMQMKQQKTTLPLSSEILQFSREESAKKLLNLAVGAN